jgi:hypothetical protein
MRSPYLTVLVFVMVGLAPRAAHATANFPPAIQSHLQLAAAPDCSICHNDGDQGGKGTATQPFALNMKARGLVEFDTGTLTSALDKMAADKVDSTGDCLDDIDELKAGHDPNDPDPPGFCGDAGLEAGAPVSGGGPNGETPPPESPTYGCVGQVAPTRSPGPPIFLLWFVAASIVIRRRRARELPHS